MPLFYLSLYAAACRSHGIGGLGGVLKWFSLIVFTLGFGYGSYTLYGWFATPLVAATVFGLTTGHGRFFAMQGANLNDPNPEWIEKYLVLPWYKGNIQTPLYSWVCMGIKGIMIGLPIMPFGLALGLLWPASYAVSFKYTQSSALAEYLRGYFTGVILCLSLLT